MTHLISPMSHGAGNRTSTQQGSNQAVRRQQRLLLSPGQVGNVTALTGITGTLVEQYSYNPFGQVFMYDGNRNPISTSAYGNRFFFQGREYIAALNIYDFRNRAYSPDLGRFLQMDPSGFNGGNNLYRFVGNNPVTGTDPMGLDDLVDDGGGGGGDGGGDDGTFDEGEGWTLTRSTDDNGVTTDTHTNAATGETQTSYSYYQNGVVTDSTTYPSQPDGGSDSSGGGLADEAAQAIGLIGQETVDGGQAGLKLTIEVAVKPVLQM